MSSKSLQFLDVSGAKTVEELRELLKDNFDALKLLIDGLTGESLEDWTPVLRDGSVPMTGDLEIYGGALRLKDSDGVEQVSLRRGGDGALEHMDGVSPDWTPVYDPEYRDVTDDRALDTVYQNSNKHRLCQITVKMSTA